ncbi:outer membrane protein assembly factor BamB family protein [Streptomyces sp. URMC 123]|uniref:outer membrane protein assembly factor BamB family protein n=1 Tax=Streptomyces sp. URMC 123 TaxID=3423403 RepID=UPI003F52E636
MTLPLATAAHQTRPVPYGDRLTVHEAAAAVAPAPKIRLRGRVVEAYDPRTGARQWTYARLGRRPVTVRSAPGHAVALWDDGMVTDTGSGVDGSGGAVRWHRAIPGAGEWLASRSARRGAGVLRPLDPDTRMLAVVTPRRIAAYRTADGDLRWVLPARPGCAFQPHRAVQRGSVLLLAQPCQGERRPAPPARGTRAAARTGGPAVGGGPARPAGDPSWTSELIAVDSLGPVTPDRSPLGNEVRGRRGKPVAHHR